MTQFIPVIERLSPRVIRILGCNPGPFTLQGTNTYLIGTGTRRILLDSGEPEKVDYLEALKRVMADEKVQLQEIVLSHWHYDHVGGLGDIHRQVQTLNDLRLSKFQRLEEPDLDPVAETTIRYRFIEDGALLETVGATLEAVFTPGHSTDHAAFYLKEENAIFSGDCILGEGTAVFEDLFDYMKSLERLLKFEPRLIYPGHGPVVDDPVSRIEHYIAHRRERERQILESLAETSLSIPEIVANVYPTLAENLLRGARNNVEHHLTKLVKENKVMESDHRYSLL